MPNPYHNAAGEFASRDGLVGSIENQLSARNASAYLAERENLDSIEREKSKKSFLSLFGKKADKVTYAHEDDDPESVENAQARIALAKASPILADDGDDPESAWDAMRRQKVATSSLVDEDDDEGIKAPDLQFSDNSEHLAAEAVKRETDRKAKLKAEEDARVKENSAHQQEAKQQEPEMNEPEADWDMSW